MGSQVKYSFLIFPALMLFASSGCKHEQKTTTKINSDGSCERIIVVKSAGDTVSSFPLPRDPSWTTRIEGDSEKVFVASKKFNDVNAINNDYRIPDKIGVEVKFEKHFRWFYTYFDYSETYKSYFPFKRISLTSYLNKKEYEQYEKGDTAKSLKEKLDVFIMRNVNEEFYGQLIDSVEVLRDPMLPVSSFEAKRTVFIDSSGYIFKDGKDDIGYLENLLGIKLKGKMDHQIDGITKSINRKIDFFMNGHGSYSNEVIMPGIILNTNAGSVEGNKVTWKMNEEKYLYSDYSMTVESRIANPWATYTTGGVLFILVVLLLLPRAKIK
jgi:hypothetical protein